MKNKGTNILGIIIAVVFGAMVAFLILTTIQDCRAGRGAFTSRADYWGYGVIAEAAEENHEEETETPETANFETIARYVEIRNGVLTERRRNDEATMDSQADCECRESTQGSDEGTVEESSAACEDGSEKPKVVQSENADIESGMGKDLLENTRPTVICAGHEMPADILEELNARLEENKIGWWLPYAACQMFQESRFNRNAENKNGLDKGLFQYRIKYWNPANGDIFDYRAQIALYVQQTANRLRSGCSIEETISRHMMSDYGDYNPIYVQDVLRWMDRLEVR